MSSKYVAELEEQATRMGDLISDIREALLGLVEAIDETVEIVDDEDDDAPRAY
jgi:hypothetical protein